MEERLQRIEDQLQHLIERVESSLAWQGKVAEFVDEMTPVAKTMMDTGIEQLGGLEQRGYFRFAQDLAEAVRRVVENYEPDSLPELADAFRDVVTVLRLLSRPRILAAAQDLADGFDEAGSQPIEVLGAAKRIETEKDIQRGLAFALDLFGTLGRSVARAPRLHNGRPAPAKRAQTRAAALPAPTTTAPAPEFSFVPDEEWSRGWADEMAQNLGLSLSEEMWKIVEFSRQEFKETHKAPNLRRISKALDVPTKELYAFFPTAPGTTISRIAGVPKPAGCL